jgi:hypothetical protein
MNQYLADMTGIPYDAQNSNDKARQEYFLERDMGYDEFLETIKAIGYASLRVFCDEIGINKNTPSTTWKIQGKVPYLVKTYVLSKFEN